MGRRGPRQRRKCGEAALRQNPQGQSLLAGGADPTRPCGGAHQGDTSLSALSSPGRTAWEAAGDHGGGALDHAERLSYAFPQCTLPRTGGHYFDERRRHDTVDRLAQRIEHLGYHVSLALATTLVA